MTVSLKPMHFAIGKHAFILHEEIFIQLMMHKQMCLASCSHGKMQPAWLPCFAVLPAIVLKPQLILPAASKGPMDKS